MDFLFGEIGAAIECPGVAKNLREFCLRDKGYFIARMNLWGRLLIGMGGKTYPQTSGCRKERTLIFDAAERDLVTIAPRQFCGLITEPAVPPQGRFQIELAGFHEGQHVTRGAWLFGDARAEYSERQPREPATDSGGEESCGSQKYKSENDRGRRGTYQCQEQ